jgi:hypothetical protein
MRWKTSHMQAARKSNRQKEQLAYDLQPFCLGAQVWVLRTSSPQTEKKSDAIFSQGLEITTSGLVADFPACKGARQRHSRALTMKR